LDQHGGGADAADDGEQARKEARAAAEAAGDDEYHCKAGERGGGDQRSGEGVNRLLGGALHDVMMAQA